MNSMAKVVTIKRLHDRDRDDLHYWRSRPLEERIAQVEELRGYFHGWGEDEARRNFLKFIECCVAREVRFLIVGGYALAAHGHPRYTKDLDVWVLMDPANAERTMGAIADFGFGAAGLAVEDLLDPKAVIQMGQPPHRIDVLPTIDGVDFDACWPNRIELTVGDLTIPFIGEADFIANKRTAGRPQELADIDALTD